MTTNERLVTELANVARTTMAGTELTELVDLLRTLADHATDAGPDRALRTDLLALADELAA